MFSFRYRTATFGRLYVGPLSPWQISFRDNKVYSILFCLYNESKTFSRNCCGSLTLTNQSNTAMPFLERVDASENKLDSFNGETLEVFPCFFQFYRRILLGRPHLEMLTSSLDFNLFGNGFINIPKLTGDKSGFSKVIAHVLPLWCCVKNTSGNRQKSLLFK